MKISLIPTLNNLGAVNFNKDSLSVDSVCLRFITFTTNPFVLDKHADPHSGTGDWGEGWTDYYQAYTSGKCKQ